MRRLAAAASIAALVTMSGPAGATPDPQANVGCAIAAPGVPATLTGFALIVLAIALGHRRRQ